MKTTTIALLVCAVIQASTLFAATESSFTTGSRSWRSVSTSGVTEEKFEAYGGLKINGEQEASGHIIRHKKPQPIMIRKRMFGSSDQAKDNTPANARALDDLDFAYERATNAMDVSLVVLKLLHKVTQEPGFDKDELDRIVSQALKTNQAILFDYISEADKAQTWTWTNSQATKAAAVVWKQLIQKEGAHLGIPVGIHYDKTDLKRMVEKLAASKRYFYLLKRLVSNYQTYYGHAHETKYDRKDKYEPVLRSAYRLEHPLELAYKSVLDLRSVSTAVENMTKAIEEI